MKYPKILLFLLCLAPLHAQKEADKYRYAYFSGGSFWSTEAVLEKIPGVIEALSGYAGGKEANPSYEQVIGGKTSHRETVRVTYDYNLVSYEQLLDAFIRTVNPTDGGGSFTNRGAHYSTALYYTDDSQLRAINILMKNIALLEPFRGKKLYITVQRYAAFYPAEEYHQDFYKKNKAQYTFYRYNSGQEEYIQKVWKNIPSKFLTIDEAAYAESPYFTKLPYMEKFVNFKKPPKEELKKSLSPLSYKVTQENGTERPFSADNFNDEKRRGLYVDIVSGEPLFSSNDKFDSGTGWPSFTRPIHKEMLVEKADNSFFTRRTEVRSKYADSHLGHVFEDGPGDRGGLRYCMNGAAMRFIPYEDLEKEGYGEFKSQI